MTTLHAFREDGTEVLPGETITMTGTDHTFRAATRVSNDARTDGMIAVDGYPEMYSAPYGLTVRAVSGQPEPETWVQHIWDATAQSPVSAEPAPEPDVAGALALVDQARGTDAELVALLTLADEVRAQLARPGDADELAAEANRAARTTAPPVPGITQNTGHTVYAVLPSQDGRWWVAMKNEREHVTWDAETTEGGTLAYNTGHYHINGEGSEAEALADLANRAGVFTALTDLSSGVAARESFQSSHASVMTELSGVYGVGRARVRSGLLEAAALGYARISWHERGTRNDYGIRYDRYRCVFTWNRVN